MASYTNAKEYISVPIFLQKDLAAPQVCTVHAKMLLYASIHVCRQCIMQTSIMHSMCHLLPTKYARLPPQFPFMLVFCLLPTC